MVFPTKEIAKCRSIATELYQEEPSRDKYLKLALVHRTMSFLYESAGDHESSSICQEVSDTWFNKFKLELRRHR
jgi:hypothetical protein